MEEDERYLKLQQQIELLQKQLAAANQQILQYQQVIRQQYYANMDYVPYPEENDYR